MTKQLGALFFFVLIAFLFFKQESPKTNTHTMTNSISQEESSTSSRTKQFLVQKPLQKIKPQQIKNQENPQQKLQVLDEILASKNDNDPRLDTDFLNLSSETKRKFRKKYKGLSREQLNSRGTILFILGENLTTREDIEFFKTVLAEPPCLSLSHCEQKPAHTTPHLEDMDATTLIYPQIVVLQAFENNLQREQRREFKKMIKEGLLATKTANHPVIREMANQVIQKMDERL